MPRLQPAALQRARDRREYAHLKARFSRQVTAMRAALQAGETQQAHATAPNPITSRTQGKIMKTTLVSLALAAALIGTAFLLTACGGGDFGPDDPDRTTQPVDCKTDPKLCV